MSVELPPLPQGVSGQSLVVQMNDRLRRITLALNEPAAAAAAGAGAVIYGTHLDRVSRPVPGAGSVYVETDRNNIEYIVLNNAWVYLSGVYPVATPSAFAALTSSLGMADIGLQVFDETHFRIFVWAAQGAAPASTTPGWTRGAGELPTGYIGILPFGPGQMASGWSACDGATGVSITQDDGSLLSVTAPNFAGAYAKGGTYNPTPNNAILPTIGGYTELASTGVSVSPATASAGAAATGTGQAVLTALTGGGGAVSDPQHKHALTSADAPIALPGDPVKNVVVPFYMKL